MNAKPCVLLHCRGGFEGECAAEVQACARALGVSGFAKARPGTALVAFVPREAAGLAALEQGLRFDELVFARQILFSSGLVEGLPPGDRVAPLIAAAAMLGRQFGEIVTETADTNDGKELSPLARKLTPPLVAAARQAGLLPGRAGPRLHFVLCSTSSALVGFSVPGNSSAWPMGVPRLKFPPGAPSRSTLKLAEAFVTFFPTDSERRARLASGMRAVDLGASPGGWTYQFVDRGIHVVAVDNGPLDPALMASGLVDHRREDGLRFRPERPVDWMVCDMVEQPARIAALAAGWLADGACRATVFNLKLPMKKRLDEVGRCKEIIAGALQGRRYLLRLKQLFHDREEVTGLLLQG